MSADQELQIVDPVHSCLLPCGLAMLLHPHSGIVLQRLPPKGLIPEKASYEEDYWLPHGRFRNWCGHLVGETI